MALMKMPCAVGAGGGKKFFFQKYTNPGGPLSIPVDFEPRQILYCRANYDGSITINIAIDLDSSTTTADYYANGNYTSQPIASMYEYSSGIMQIKDLNSDDRTVYVFAQE